MTVAEHQILEYGNLLSYRCRITASRILHMARSMCDNIDVLDLKVCGAVIIGQHEHDVEFLIPVDKIAVSTDRFIFKSVFKLSNAVRLRHYGSYDTIDDTVKILQKYIAQNYLIPDSDPYILINSMEREVYDVFVGISDNIL